LNSRCVDVPTILNRHYLLLLLFKLVLVVALYSCKSTRSIIREPLKEEGPEYLLGQLEKSEFNFTWLSAKFSASYTADKSSADFKGQLRIRKDSMIWISISPALGIEMIRLQITQDSVKYMNRFNKTYFTGDFVLIREFLGANLDFDILQSFLIGNDFQFYETASFRASIDNREYKLSTSGRRKIRKYAKKHDENPIVLVQNLWLNPQNFKISRVNIKEYARDNIKLEALYDDFESIDTQLFPNSLSIQISGEENLSMRVHYSRINLNEPLAFPFRIPEKYQQIF